MSSASAIAKLKAQRATGVKGARVELAQKARGPRKRVAASKNTDAATKKMRARRHGLGLSARGRPLAHDGLFDKYKGPPRFSPYFGGKIPFAKRASLPQYLVDEMRGIETALGKLGKGDLTDHRYGANEGYSLGYSVVDGGGLVGTKYPGKSGTIQVPSLPCPPPWATSLRRSLLRRSLPHLRSLASPPQIAPSLRPSLLWPPRFAPHRVTTSLLSPPRCFTPSLRSLASPARFAPSLR